MAAPFKNIIFNRPNGSIFRQDVIPRYGNDNTTNYHHIRSAGLMTVAYIPVIGDTSVDETSPNYFTSKLTPFNACTAELYIRLRSANVSLGNYSPADIGKALLALDSVYGLLSELDTDINALSKYSFDNTALRGLIQQALWKDPDTAAKNIANIITERNNLADKLSIIPFVPGLPFLQDHIDWARFIYKDDNLDKSALILFRRAGVWRWATNANDAHPGDLILFNNPLNYDGYSDIDEKIIYAEDKFTILSKLIKDYTMDEDFQNLCVEIAHAFGIDKAKYHIPYLPEDTTKFKLETKYDLDVIDSLRSADFCLLTYGSSVHGITEDTNGNLVYSSDLNGNPTGKFTTPHLFGASGNYRGIDTGEGRVLFSYEDSPTEDAVCTIVRYVHDYKVVNPTQHSYPNVYGLKTEFLTGLRIYYLEDDRTFAHIDETSFVIPTTSTILNGGKTEAIVASLISHPMCYGVQISSTGEFVGTINYFPKDIDNLGYLPKIYNITYSESYMWTKFFGKPNTPYQRKEDRNPKTNTK